MPPDVADALLRIEALSLVRRVEWFPELGSTNDHALELAAAGETDTPLLVWADRQRAGRGRNGHAWWSAGGALTFSLLLSGTEAGLPRGDWPRVALLVGLTVAHALDRIAPGERIAVKWPNDVLLNGKKLCGILMEPAPTHADRLVIGIGVNVANSFRAAPPELQATATALCDELTRAVTPVEVLLAILVAWRETLRRYHAGAVHLADEWRARCHLTDHPIRLTTGEGVLEGRCRGIDSSGALLIETSQGLVRRVAGTVRRLDG